VNPSHPLARVAGRIGPGGRAVLDRVAAALIVLALATVIVRASLRHAEWSDWVAYALPGANYVERGVLALPQLGPQMGLDRHYLLNAPWMVVGPIPWYWSLGVGRLGYVAGVATLGVACLGLYVLAIRKVFGPISWAASASLAAAFAANRNFLIEVILQRYSILCFAALLVAFWPTTGPSWRRPWWTWAAAASLPMVHPALVIGLGFWGLGLLGSLLPGAVEARADEVEGPRRDGWAGPMAFAALIAAGFAWYGRPALLREQFLPHVRFGNYRSEAGFKILQVPAALPFSAPTLAMDVGLACLGPLLTAGWAILPRWRRSIAPVLPAALALAFVLVADALRGFAYIHYYALGLGPWLLWPLRGPATRRAALAVLSAVAMANLAVSAYMERGRIDTAGTAEAIDFVVARTRPTDHLVLGPPFVLASSPPALPGGRVVERVVPQPYYLDDFDEAAFRREIADRAWVYVGDPQWFRHPVYTTPPGAPLFPDADVEEATFDGDRVIVARARRPGAAKAP
jgi:hypothetical protein